MKLSLLSILCCFFQVMATEGYSQKKVDIHLKDVTLIEALDNIKEKTGNRFFYKENVIDAQHKVSLDLKNVETKEILSHLFANMNVEFIIQKKQIILRPKKAAVTPSDTPKSRLSEYSGVVSDSEAAPLSGINVKVKGKQKKTNTNSKGIYKISATNTDILVFSSPGSSSKEVLLSSLEAQDLVVNASLEVSNHKVSGTITHDGFPLAGATVIIKNTSRGTSSNFDGYYEILAQAQDTLTVSYLGYTTQEIPIQGRNNIDIEMESDAMALDAVEITGAYYSLDERTRTGNVTKINKDQLEQQVVQSPMEALQGRVAGLEIETISGLRGHAPRVILRGQSSLRGKSSSQPLYIIDGVPINNEEITSLSMLYPTGIDPLATIDPSLIESIEVLKDADATAIYGSRGANGVILINTKRGVQGKTKLEIQTEMGISWAGKFMDLMNTEQYLEMRREAFENDGVAPTTANAPDLMLWDQDRYTDWQKELLGGNAEFQKYQASVSGGNEQTTFLLSGGFQKETTIFPGDFGFQNNNLLANINHRSKDNKLQLNTSINYGYRKSSLFRVGAFVNNSVLLAPNTPELFDENGDINWELDEFGNPTLNNPMAGLADPNTMRMQSLQWNGNINYKLLNDFEIIINIGFNDVFTNDEQLLYKKNTNPLRAATAMSTTTKKEVARKHFIIEPQLHYNLKFGEHQISSLVGSTYQKNENTNLSLRGQGYFSDSQVGNVALAQNQSIIYDDLIRYRYAAAFGRIGYSYTDKYYLNLTGRRDGSSRFGKKRRFGNFGAIGAAWEFYKENFVGSKMPWLSYGKLRGSYGTTGSDNIGDYQYRDSYSNVFVQSGSLSSGGLVPSKLHNSYYHWEKNTKLEVALDLSFLQDKVQLAASWYRERSGNQLMGMPLPSITGFLSVQGNLAATVQNTGLELVLQTTPVQDQDFSWTSNGNLTIPKNKLLEYPDLENSSYASLYEVGKSLNIDKLYNNTGIDPATGKYTFKDVNGDGVLNNEDKIIIVDMTRKFYGGWQNQLQYKNWNLSFLFEFMKQKGKSPNTSFGILGGRTNAPIEALDRWQKQGDSDKDFQGYTDSYDAGVYNYFSSDVTIVDASFIRMKSVSLNYNIPKNSLDKISMQQAQVYLNAQNLFTISSYKGYDPQRTSGIDLPALTSVHVGLKLTL